jgi:hypothetical protein
MDPFSPLAPQILLWKDIHLLGSLDPYMIEHDCRNVAATGIHCSHGRTLIHMALDHSGMRKLKSETKVPGKPNLPSLTTWNSTCYAPPCIDAP